MEKIKIADIIILPDRWRKTFDPDALNTLAESIKNLGLIEPVIVERRDDGLIYLVAGERRIRAHTILGREEVEVEFKENLDEWHRRSIELDENIHREKLAYTEEVEAKLRIHELYQERFGKTRESTQTGWVGKREGGWTTEQTADLLGEAVGGLRQDLQLAKAIRLDPSLGRKETKQAALRAMKVGGEHLMMKEIAEILAGARLESGEMPVQVINGDARVVLKKYEDESFNFCITDPPYGIGVHDMQDTFPNRGEVRQGIEFDDAKAVLESVVKPVMQEVHRLLMQGSHCYVFFAIARYTEVRALLEEIGFWVCSTPLLWIKNNALNLRPHISYPVNYEPIFYCSKGYPPRPLTSIQPLSTFDHPILSGVKKVHPTEKPLQLVKKLIENCSQPKERGVDPFVGGGTFTLGCKELDRLAVGVEIDGVWSLEARMKLEE